MPSQSTMTLLFGVKNLKTFELSSRFFLSNICMLFFHQYRAKRINVLFFILIYLFLWLFFRGTLLYWRRWRENICLGQTWPSEETEKIHLLNCRFSWWEIKTSMNLIQKAFTLFFYITWRILCNFFSLLGFTSQNIGEYFPYYFEFEKKNLNLFFMYNSSGFILLIWMSQWCLVKHEYSQELLTWFKF